jgi:hypothetical protein
MKVIQSEKQPALCFGKDNMIMRGCFHEFANAQPTQHVIYVHVKFRGV